MVSKTLSLICRQWPCINKSYSTTTMLLKFTIFTAELVSIAPYSPDLFVSDFHLLIMRKPLKGDLIQLRGLDKYFFSCFLNVMDPNCFSIWFYLILFFMVKISKDTLQADS